MRITGLELTTFTFTLEGVDAQSHVYDPDHVSTRPGFILTVETSTGAQGTYRGFGWTPPIVAQVEMVADQVLGRDPLEREGIWQDLWVSLRHSDRMGISPIDIALWDLAGHHFGASIATLLGGYRDRIPAYASTYLGDDQPDGLSSPAAYADFARTCRDRGYPGYKIHAFGDPAEDIAVCRAVAAEVGDEMDLMLDPASAYDTYAETLRVGRVLDELGFFWYEDPMGDGGESIAMASRLADELDTPILGGEHVRGAHYGTANHLQAGAMDLVRGDAHEDGGITGAMKMAALAEAHGTDIEFHHAGPAHLHCLSAIRNANYVEHGLVHPEVDWVLTQGLTETVERIDGDGTMPVPDGDGLGVEIDWEFVDRQQTDQVRFE